LSKNCIFTLLEIKERMKTLVANFSKQLAEAITIGENASLTPAKTPISNVLICGLGGSGIGGSIVSELVVAKANVPIHVTKGYFIPAYVNENTLVIISSYSGNTEETLNCMELAIAKNAKIVGITSGGKVQEICSAQKFDCITVPAGMPPRACLGYSLTQLFFVFGFHKIIDNAYKAELQAAIKLIDAEENNIQTEAKILAEKLNSKTPVLYATTYNEGMLIRFRQQLNENAKMLCWHQIIPEMNHNELVGWREKNENLAVFIFRDADEYERNNFRIGINKETISKYTSNITEVYSKGKSPIEKAIYFIHLGDWISVVLAEMRGYDANEIAVINQLKSALSKI